MRVISICSIILFFCSTWCKAAISNEYVTEGPDTLFIDPDTLRLTRYDFVPDFTASDVKKRLTECEGGIKLTYNPHVFSFVDFLTVRNREYSRMILRRQYLYMPIFEKYLKKYGLPDELKYLSIVESGLNPKALSRSGALGLWQFIPSTGKQFGLKIDAHFDERMDIEKSTEAACKYLRILYNMFDDWHLALAAYNCGPGAVSRVVKRSHKKDFWKIFNYLPSETRSYVPQFIAVTYVMKYAKEHNLEPDFYDQPMMYDTIHVSQYVNLEILCKHLGVCMQDITTLNPDVKRNYLPNTIRGYSLKIPSDKYQFTVDNRQALLDSASIGVNTVTEFNKKLSATAPESSGKKIVHLVRRGQNLSTIARQYKVTVTQLKRWNNLRSVSVKKGQRIVIWKGKAPATKLQATKKGRPSYTSTKKKSYYQVKNGDTLWSIAKKYNNIPVERIKKLNNIGEAGIKVGQKLLISL